MASLYYLRLTQNLTFAISIPILSSENVLTSMKKEVHMAIRSLSKTGVCEYTGQATGIGDNG